MSAPREIRIAVPDLADALARLAAQGDTVRLPATEWLVARGRAEPADVDGWRDWLLAGAGLGDRLLTRFPAGPCSAAIDSGAAPAGTWARAEPVHLLTALDHLQLAAPVPLELDAADSAALLAMLNAHLAGTGFALRAAGDGGWLCACPPGIDVAVAEPAQAIGRNLREWLPVGPAAATVRSLVNELQMLLHEHPVNQRRAARKQPIVNSVWLWGFGAAGRPVATTDRLLLTDDPWLRGLWRLHGGAVRAPDELQPTLDGGATELRVAVAAAFTAPDEARALLALDAQMMAPARALLAASRAGRVLLHTGRYTVEVTAAARWRFWRRSRPLARVNE